MRSQQRGHHLALATTSFALCFAGWGLVSAFSGVFRERFVLSATQTALLVAVPVLLGALARLPLGMLADRFGARWTFTLLMVGVAVPVALVPAAASFPALLGTAFLLGVAGSSFAVGVSYVSRWTPPERQGAALGVYGLGNAGQSAAVFLGPVVATVIGWERVFHASAALLALWGVAFGLLARDAPARTAPQGLAEAACALREPLAWLLSAFYFLTFGGFVAFSIYLPTLLRDVFSLSVTDAGFRTAGFVVLATLVRPIGGLLADHIGGARVLSGVFAGLVPFALLLAWESMIPFTVGALGCAALLGLGNGAVFKLVPQYFPERTGTVTGLVGAMGGLGGFFPPLLLGLFRDRTGEIWPGFVLLAATAAVLWVANRQVFVPRQEGLERLLPPALRHVPEALRAAAVATLATALLVASIVVGSRNLQNFDAALVVYTFAVIFATWGVVYHYSTWLQRPPTGVFWRRGFELVRERGLLASGVRLATVATTHLAGQGFIRHRSPARWAAHQLIFWGCVLAVAITFPLVFGWVHFRTPADDLTVYVTYVFGFPTMAFPVDSLLGWTIIHGLDFAAVMVLAGISLALWRRFRDAGALALQSFAQDFFPLFLLFAVSVTGLALTASTAFLKGQYFSFLSILHAVTVVATLLYLPFGKLFHVFQRPAQLGVKLYQDAGDAGPGAACRGCGERFASAMHVGDLKRILPELGFDYTLDEAGTTWQEVCPACKRKALARAQLRMKEEETRG